MKSPKRPRLIIAAGCHVDRLWRWEKHRQILEQFWVLNLS